MAEVQAPMDLHRVSEQLAELIGQTQHLIELQEALVGRNPYAPIVVDLHVGTSQIVNLPAEACQIEQVQVSGDTAVTTKFFLVSDISGPAGKLIGQIYMPANAPVPALALNCPVTPGGNPGSNTLIITTSAAIANGSCVITLARTRPGGYPYAG